MPHQGSEDRKSLYAQLTQGKTSSVGMMRARMKNADSQADYVVTTNGVVQGLMETSAGLPMNIKQQLANMKAGEKKRSKFLRKNEKEDGDGIQRQRAEFK